MRDTSRTITIEPGHYALKQLLCKSQVIAWSHRARFARASELVGAIPSGRLLDYGCGDGTLIASVAERFAECLGADVADDQIEDCRHRLKPIANVSFCAVRDLDPVRYGQFDVLTCLETLEHCTADVVDCVLADLRRMVTSNGRIIISVPIEIGPTFIVKSVLRRTAALRGVSDYKFSETYSWKDAARMITASGATAIERCVYHHGEKAHHSHHGFNWRGLRRTIAKALVIERTEFTPLGVPGGCLDSQVWFLCRAA